MSARRSTSLLYCSQLTLRVTIVSFRVFAHLAEGMMHEDGLVALRAGRDHGDRHARERFDPAQISSRGRRQRIEALDAERVLVPPGKLFVDRLAFGDGLRSGRQQRDRLAVDAIAGADPERGQSVEHVELGDAQSVHSVELQRTSERGYIEPSAA